MVSLPTNEVIAGAKDGVASKQGESVTVPPPQLQAVIDMARRCCSHASRLHEWTRDSPIGPGWRETSTRKKATAGEKIRGNGPQGKPLS
ncbi:hypothetical protein MKX08_005110 [Trichoderma sp. CBMAI-0020]|nr:hypothetical protein MKX08_005110 [Trichoderma sp. CBMAI-0020]